MIVLALVAKSSHILAETHDPAHDRFLPAAQTILSRIPPNSSKLSYAFEDWLFHYVSQDGLVYMAVADADTGRRVPFSFLAHVQKKVRFASSLAPFSFAVRFALADFFLPCFVDRCHSCCRRTKYLIRTKKLLPQTTPP